MEDSKESKGSPGGLDLGLSALIKSANGQAAPTTADEELDPNRAPKVTSDTSTAKSAVPEDARQLMADKGLWKELSAYCERVMAGEDASPVNKLWWIKSQLQLKSAPLNILAAPLESASEAVFGSEHSSVADKSLAADLLCEIGRGARDSKDYAVAISFFERAWPYKPSAKDDLMHVVALEKERLEAESRVRKSDDLELKLKKLEQLEILVGLSPQSTKGVEPHNEFARPLTLKIPEISHKDERKTGRLYVFAIGALIAFFVTAWLVRLNYLETIDTIIAKSSLTDLTNSSSLRAAPILPELPRRTGLGDLDGVFYELGAKGQKSVATAGATAESVTTSSALPEAPQKESSKESINTEGPVRTGAIDVRPEPPQRADELFQKPERLPRSNSRSPLPMGDVAPVEIEQFGTDKEFEVEADTEIMSKPSWSSAPVDNVYKGDRVRAEAKIGNWLKLRSQAGRVGYVSTDYVHQK